jgi:heptosyltransferase II
LSTSLVVQTSFLGDMVLTTPLLRRLAERGPVDVVATPAAAALLANDPAVRETIVYDKRGAARGIRGVVRLARRLRHARYDVAYHAQGSARSAALTLLARVPERVGFSTSAGRALYTRQVLYRDDRHHAERLLRLALGDGITELPADALRPRLYPGRTEREAVDALLRAAGHDGGALVALAPGSVWATKRWPYYPELARSLAARGRVIVIGGTGDGALASEIAAALPPGERPIDATGRLSLLASAELIGRAVLLVTNDSAPQHLASAMGTPTVTVFGPTVPEFGFGPLAPRSATVGHPALACRPCDRHGPQRCPLGHWRCMRETGPEQVLEAVEQLSHVNNG